MPWNSTREILILAASWMNLQEIMVSEKNANSKRVCTVFHSLTFFLIKKKIEMEDRLWLPESSEKEAGEVIKWEIQGVFVVL